MISSVAVVMLILPVAGALLSVMLKGRARPAALVTAALSTAAAVWLTVAKYGSVYTKMLWHVPWLRGIVDVPVLGFLVDPLASVMLLVAAPIGFLTVLFSTAYLTDKNREHPVKSEHYGQDRKSVV